MFNLPDPVHFRRGMLQVCQGVPTKAGEQKRFISNLEGYSATRATSSPVVPTPRRLVSVVPAAKPGWYVGANENAFEVGVHFQFTRQLSIDRQGSPSFPPTSTPVTAVPTCEFVTGLVDLERHGRRIVGLSSCQHLEAAMLGSLYEDSEKCETRGFPLGSDSIQSWNEGESDAICIIPSAGNKWSRWMAILYVDKWLRRGGREDFRVFVRDPNGCPACAVKAARAWLQERYSGPEDRIDPGRVVIVL